MKLKYAQDVFKSIDTSAGCGFNMKVMGDRPPNYEYYDFFERSQGYDKAIEMANVGKIYYTHVFKCKCGGFPFIYGGFFVCNDCGSKNVDSDWWAIKTYKDGDKWYCVGLGFDNLLSSNNFSFGKTRQESIDNYEKKMLRYETPKTR